MSKKNLFLFCEIENSNKGSYGVLIGFKKLKK